MSNQVGIGNIGLKGITPQSGPPFAANSAENGLSVDPVTGAIVLGQDVLAATGPAELLSNRFIPVDGFSIAYIDPVANTFGHNAELLEFQHFDGTEVVVHGQGRITLTGNDSIYPKTPHILFQDDSLALATVWLIRNLAGIFTIEDSTTANAMLQLDFSTLLATLGDVDGQGGGTRVATDDGNLAVTAQTTAGAMLQLFQLAGVYQFGDLGAIGNQSAINIIDAAQRIIAQIAGNTLLDIDQANDFYSLGNTLAIELDNALNIANISDGVDRYLELDIPAGLHRLGDIDGALNGNTLSVDDTNSNLILDNTASNMGILINGVAGFTGTVTPVTTITVNSGIVTNVA